MPYADPEARRAYSREYYKSDEWHAWYRTYRADPTRKRQERNAYYLRNYGISLDEYLERVAEQKGLCAICLKPETEIGNSGEIRGLAVDHDHDTNEVRGLLCRSCNVGLGHFKDDPALLRLALRYLEGGDVQ